MSREINSGGTSPSTGAASDSAETTTTRRKVLLAGATTAAAAVAGCEGISEQSFEASPVTLGGPGDDTLQLAEIVAESQTIERSAGGAEITITNHVAVYSRSEWLETEGGE